MKKKIIKFRPKNKKFEYLDGYPTKSLLNIPDWYKETSNRIDKNNKSMWLNGGTNLTIKSCIPFLDAITCGYMITLPFDIYVEKNPKNGYKIHWEIDMPNFIDHHSKIQFSNLNVPKEFEEDAYKFNQPYIVETPPGYSSLITHPLNRIDLPFYTLSGVVDSDLFTKLPINLPFFLKKDFQGIIEKNTPIAQVIPFKREKWTHQKNKYSEEQSLFAMDELKSTIFGSYKKRFWSKKEYE